MCIRFSRSSFDIFNIYSPPHRYLFILGFIGVILYFVVLAPRRCAIIENNQSIQKYDLHNNSMSNDAKLFDELPVAMINIATDGTIIRANIAATKLLGRQDITDLKFRDIVEGLGRSITDRMRDTMKGFGIGRPEMARCLRENEEVFIQVAMSKMRRDKQDSILAVLNDATEFKTLEAQFVQSQKMQAVGQLAGGVAHDFNNILTAITGHADLLLQRSDPHKPDYDDLIQIKQNSNRAAALISQLLAFSRKQTLRPKSIKLDDTLAELSHLLNRLLGEKVALCTEHGKDLSPVRVDERQFEQVIMNLVVNARDAMPDGGTVNITTKNLTLDHELHRDRATVPPGDYVIVEVSDTGVGIHPDKQAKIFEPFYTTKKVGEGTGLGLSTVYGIIKQTGGFIFVDSTEGEGTKFSVYMPVNDAVFEVEAEKIEERPTVDLTGKGNVLLVEDEAPVRSFAARALSMRGYTVTEAASGEEALDIISDSFQSFDIYISDVIMPGKNGPTWVREALKKTPDVKVVFVSGYAEDAFEDDQQEIPNAGFLAKPFSLADLTQIVKEKIEV